MLLLWPEKDLSSLFAEMTTIELNINKDIE